MTQLNSWHTVVLFRQHLTCRVSIRPFAPSSLRPRRDIALQQAFQPTHQTEQMERAREILKSTFGYDSFKPAQEEVRCVAEVSQISLTESLGNYRSSSVLLKKIRMLYFYYPPGEESLFVSRSRRCA